MKEHLKLNVAAKASLEKVPSIYLFLVVCVCDKFLGIEEVVQAYQIVGTTYMLHQKHLSVNGSSLVFN